MVKDVEKICPICGMKFYTDNDGKKYCSRRCSVRYRSKRRKERLESKDIVNNVFEE